MVVVVVVVIIIIIIIFVEHFMLIYRMLEKESIRCD